MNGKEQIAAVLAHEVKNPVSLIKMNVQYIKDFCPKALENNFTVIEKELEKLNHIINDYTIMAENTKKELGIRSYRKMRQWYWSIKPEE